MILMHQTILISSHNFNGGVIYFHLMGVSAFR